MGGPSGTHISKEIVVGPVACCASAAPASWTLVAAARNDLHQDHRLLSELRWNTFRNHLILEYELANYDGDVGSPNLFVPLDEGVCGRKIEYIMKFFRSQADKHWCCPELFMSVFRLRGMEANPPIGQAEGFYCRKAVLGMGAHEGPDRAPIAAPSG